MAGHPANDRSRRGATRHRRATDTVHLTLAGSSKAAHKVIDEQAIARDGTLVVRAVGRSRAESPLRYPGGKAALAGFFGDAISRLQIDTPIYVEPYAGGAGAGISLLLRGQVDNLVINDIDPAVYCFWRAVTEETDKFVDSIYHVDLDVEEWRKQKEIYRTADETDPFELGFSFFYLNRTNRSGILHAGPIGGVRQNGNYKIDARFNREQLASRVTKIGERRNQIRVSSVDGRSVAEKYASDPNAFIYADPPYVDMGGTLYLNAFTHRDHAELAGALSRHSDGKWIVTYDPSDFIRNLYATHDTREYQLSYSAHKAARGCELMISSSPVARLIKNELAEP